jgi:hypothetical protein
MLATARALSTEGATNQVGVSLGFSLIHECGDGVERAKDTVRRGFSVVKEEHHKRFQKTVNRDLASDNDGCFRVAQIGIELMGGIDKRLGMIPRVETNAAPDLKSSLMARPRAIESNKQPTFPTG